MNILIAGGTGYIGSHICVELLESGHDVVVIDDFSNSKPDVLDSIYKITGKHVKFYEFNVLDEEKTESCRRKQPQQCQRRWPGGSQWPCLRRRAVRRWPR